MYGTQNNTLTFQRAIAEGLICCDYIVDMVTKHEPYCKQNCMYECRTAKDLRPSLLLLQRTIASPICKGAF